MSIHVFGDKNQIALPTPPSTSSVISRTTYFTHPSIEHFYSQYGYAIPLSFGGIPLDKLIDNKFAIPFDHLDLFLDPMRFILIDHSGSIWSVVVQHHPDKQNKLIISYAYLPHDGEGWWISSYKPSEHDADKEMLLGFLYTKPTRKAIDNFFRVQRAGTHLTWLNIDDIVARLNTSYPRPPEKEVSDERTPAK